MTLDKPIAVSANTSPAEHYDSESEFPWGSSPHPAHCQKWELRLSNFPRDTYERRSAMVRVERIFMSTDNRTMIGTVAVANVAYHKKVVARFTLDYWKTVSEVVAHYSDDIRNTDKRDGYDRFNFEVALNDQAHLEAKTLQLCVRYTVNGQTYWDNNDFMNYKVDFVKKTKPHTNTDRNHSSSRPRSMPPSFDDDSKYGFDSNFTLRWPGELLEDDSHVVPLKRHPNPGNGGETNQANQRTSQVKDRKYPLYDFGLNLTAALDKAKATLGERSGIQRKPENGNAAGDPQVPSKGYFSRGNPSTNGQSATIHPPTASAVGATGTRPDTLSLGKPDLKSAEYHELISKFCFVGTPRSGVA
jgi:hypothetical protein